MKLKEKKSPEEIPADPTQKEAPKNDEVDTSRRECTLSEEMQKLLLRQLSNELYNSNLYRSFANYYGVRGFSKLEEYYLARANEESKHHSWVYYWLSYNDVEFKYPEVPAIKEEWKNMEDPFQLTVDQEINTTLNIYDIVDQALEEKDWATWNWLHDHNDETGMLVAENVEEESLSRTVRDIAMSDADWLKKEAAIYNLYFKK